MTKTEKIIRELAAYDGGGDFYSLTSGELRAVRRFLRGNRAKHRECERWLSYYSDFIPSDRPKRDPLMGEYFSSDDCCDLVRFATLCRQVLALNGIVVALS